MFFNNNFRPYCYVKSKPKGLVIVNPKIITIYEKLGFFCLTVSLLGSFFLASPYMVGESIKVLVKLQKNMESLAFKNENKDKDKVLAPEIEKTPEPTATTIVTPNPASLPFSIKIEKIGVNAKVIANIEASNPDIYEPALKKGVAHGLGSAFPGEEKMIYIFGHSTDYVWNVETYNALFYQIKDLEKGDLIVLALGDKEYKYEVFEQKIVENNDTDSINNMQDMDVLILQTCYPPGTTWKRLLVIAKPVK